MINTNNHNHNNSKSKAHQEAGGTTKANGWKNAVFFVAQKQKLTNK